MQLIKSITNVANYHKPLRLVDSLIFFEICSNGHIAREKRQTKIYKKHRWEIFNQYHLMLWCLGCGLQTNISNVFIFVCFLHKIYKDLLIASKNKNNWFIYMNTHWYTVYLYIKSIHCTLYKYKCSIWLVCNGSFSSSLAMKIDGFQFLSDLPFVCFALRCVAYGLALPDFPYFSFNTIPRKKTQLLFVFWIEIQIYDKFKRPLCTERFC